MAPPRIPQTALADAISKFSLTPGGWGTAPIRQAGSFTGTSIRAEAMPEIRSALGEVLDAAVSMRAAKSSRGPFALNSGAADPHGAQWYLRSARRGPLGASALFEFRRPIERCLGMTHNKLPGFRSIDIRDTNGHGLYLGQEFVGIKFSLRLTTLLPGDPDAAPFHRVTIDTWDTPLRTLLGIPRPALDFRFTVRRPPAGLTCAEQRLNNLLTRRQDMDLVSPVMKAARANTSANFMRDLVYTEPSGRRLVQVSPTNPSELPSFSEGRGRIASAQRRPIPRPLGGEWPVFSLDVHTHSPHSAARAFQIAHTFDLPGVSGGELVPLPFVGRLWGHCAQNIST